MRLFGHRYRVTVGTLQTEDTAIEFKCTRTLGAWPGELDLTIYNLTAEHRNEIRHAPRARGAIVTDPRQRTPVRLEAGYQEGMSLLFQGDLRRVVPAKTGPTWSLRLTAGDGYYAIRQARARRSFGPDTTVAEVARACAEFMDVGEGNVGQALAGASLDRLRDVFPRGTVLHGNAARELTRLLRSVGLEWSIQGGVLQVLPRGGALSREGPLLSADTGLIDSPEIGRFGVVKCRTLLVPDLIPGRRVRLTSALLSQGTGTYRIERAEYSGQSDGGDWTASLVLRDIQWVARFAGGGPI